MPFLPTLRTFPIIAVSKQNVNTHINTKTQNNMAPNNKTDPRQSRDPHTETRLDKKHADREAQTQMTSSQRSLCGRSPHRARRGGAMTTKARKNRMSPKKRAESNDSALPCVYYSVAATSEILRISHAAVRRRRYAKSVTGCHSYHQGPAVPSGRIGGHSLDAHLESQRDGYPSPRRRSLRGDRNATTPDRHLPAIERRRQMLGRNRDIPRLVAKSVERRGNMVRNVGLHTGGHTRPNLLEIGSAHLPKIQRLVGNPHHHVRLRSVDRLRAGSHRKTHCENRTSFRQNSHVITPSSNDPHPWAASEQNPHCSFCRNHP